MSSAKLPPIPPAGRAPGPGGAAEGHAEDEQQEKEARASDSRDRNLASQGRQGNIAQNTTHKGHQQDR